VSLDDIRPVGSFLTLRPEIRRGALCLLRRVSLIIWHRYFALQIQLFAGMCMNIRVPDLRTHSKISLV
jgi:hypothetical protein